MLVPQIVDRKRFGGKMKKKGSGDKEVGLITVTCKDLEHCLDRYVGKCVLQSLSHGLFS